MHSQSIRNRWDVGRSDHASRTARDLVTGALSAHAPAATVEDAALLTSELVSNVMRHTAGPCVLTMCFNPNDAWIEIGVTDSAPDSPLTVVDRSPHTIGGFGLRLVDRLASRWGSTHDSDSKTVWFRLGEAAVGC